MEGYSRTDNETHITVLSYNINAAVHLISSSIVFFFLIIKEVANSLRRGKKKYPKKRGKGFVVRFVTQLMIM